MRQIIIIDESFDSYQGLKSRLEEALTVEIIEINDIAKAQSLITILPELDCIIANASQLSENTIARIEKYLIEENYSTPLFVLGKATVSRKESRLISCSVYSEELFQTIKDQFLKNDTKKSKENIPLFIPIDFQFVLLHKEYAFPVDFYIRIKRGEDEYQYIKRLHAGDKFNQEEIERFNKHQVSSLYVQRNDYMSFLKDSVEKNEKTHVTQEDLQMKSAFDYHLSREMLSLTGIDEETEKLVKGNVDQMEKSVSDNVSLIHYLNMLKKNPNGFAFAHSMMVALVLNKVVTKFEWESRAIKERICYAAFFHDISLLDDKLSRIHTDDELYRTKTVEYEFSSSSKIKDNIYRDNEIEMVNHHALNSALILEKFPEVPEGVSQIVKEHHGAKNGIGFNTGQSISLQPISMLFIVVEDFVHAFLAQEKPTKESIALIVHELELRYVKSNYKKAVEALAMIVR